MQQPGIRVLIADDHAPFLKTLREVLSLDPAIHVVAECSDGQQALARLREDDLDLAILDVEMPGLDGIAVCGQLGLPPQAPGVIVLTLHEEPELQRRAREAGVRGFVLKEHAVLDVLPAVHAVFAGRLYAGRQCAGFRESYNTVEGTGGLQR